MDLRDSIQNIINCLAIQGFNVNSVRALVYCAMQESTCQVYATNSSSGAVGLWQWLSNKQGLIDWMGMDPSNLTTNTPTAIKLQCEFLDQDDNNMHLYYKHLTYEQFKYNSPNLSDVELAENWAMAWERSGHVAAVYTRWKDYIATTIPGIVWKGGSGGDKTVGPSGVPDTENPDTNHCQGVNPDGTQPPYVDPDTTPTNPSDWTALDDIIDWFKIRQNNLNYSMSGMRDGSDGTADCSGALYTAMTSAGVGPKLTYIPSTVTFGAWLLSTGVYQNVTKDLPTTPPLQPGDVIILSGAGEASSAGALGHIGIIGNDGLFWHCTYYPGGTVGQAIQNNDWISYKALTDASGFHCYSVYRHI